MYEVISADSHVIEPPDVWQSRMPSEYRDMAPRLRHDADSDRVVMGDKVLTTAGLLAGCSRRDDEVRWEGRWEEDVFRGGYDPDARIKDLATDGVDAEVLFPTIAMLLYPIQDFGFQLALFRAYNRWLAEEFCAAYPDKLKGIAMITHQEVDIALHEIKHAKALGLVGIMLPLYPGRNAEYHDRRFDPLWALLSDYAMPVNLHTATTREPDHDWQKGTPTDNILNTYQVQHVILDMILSGLFDRFPNLTVVSAENDAGWAACMLERADYYWTRNRNFKFLEAGEIVCKSLPSFYFHRNVRATFMRDHGAVLARDVIGANTLLWGNDFPHHVSTWPESRRVLDEHFRNVPPKVRDMVVAGNARATYGF